MAYLDVENGGKIYYEHHKGSGRAVLNIHSWAMSLRVWDTMLYPLQKRGNAVVAFDQRCCGHSDKDFTESSIAASARDAVALVDALGLDGVVVNGWSLGGAVATETARLLGSRCAGLILTCGASPRYTQADGFPHGNKAEDVLAILEAIQPNRAEFFQNISRAVCAKPVSEATLDWMRGLFWESTPGADLPLGELATIDQREVIAQLDVPLLAIVGSDDSFTPPGIGETAAKLAKHGQVVRFEGCGHAPQIEDYPGYVAAVTTFLDRIG
jgi:pimeloyl-[acyl-carrier protein] methyl ester esterase